MPSARRCCASPTHRNRAAAALGVPYLWGWLTCHRRWAGPASTAPGMTVPATDVILKIVFVSQTLRSTFSGRSAGHWEPPEGSRQGSGLSFSAGFQALRPPWRSGHGRQAQPRRRPASRQPLLACTPLAMGLPHAALAPTHGPGTPALGLPCVSCMPWYPVKSLGNQSSCGLLAREGREGQPGCPGPGQRRGEREAERARRAGTTGQQPAQLSSPFSSICTRPRRSNRSRHSGNVPEHHKSESSEKLVPIYAGGHVTPFSLCDPWPPHPPQGAAPWGGPTPVTTAVNGNLEGA